MHPTISRRLSLVNIIGAFFFALFVTVSAASAQTTAFSYQGRLTDGISVANGSYEMQFRLFDSLAGGIQQPQPTPITITFTGAQAVQVTNGIFTVQLDFSVSAFPGADRFLEIGVRHPGDTSFTLLNPRQQLTSTPYAIQTLNAAMLGGVAASQYVQTNDSRLTDARTPTGSAGGSLSGTYPNPTLATGAINSTTMFSSSLQDGAAATTTLRSLGTGAQQAAAGNDSRLSNSRTPTGTAGGSLSGTYPNPTLATGAINSTTLFSSSLLDGSASATTLRSLGTGAQQAAAGNDSRLSNARTPTGSAGGALSGTYPNPTLGTAVVGTSTFATLPHCKARQTSAQTFPNGSFLPVRLDETQFCSGVTFDNANDRLVIVTPGVYQINAEVIFVVNGSGARAASITAAGTEAGFYALPAVQGTNTNAIATALVRLNAGDVVDLVAAQSSGGNLTTDASFGGRSASLSINWVGP